ncbi:MAG: hypothetical protein HGA71_15575 [Azonexaceae bacterium]|nr:hypothetical protein [Azonexaceae bacterium]
MTTPDAKNPAGAAAGQGTSKSRESDANLPQAAAPEYPRNLPNIYGAAFVSGLGQFHSNGPAAKKRKPYLAVTLADIRAMVDNPPSVPKENGRWFIPSTLATRTFDEQHDNGEFWILWADLDKAPRPLSEVADAVLGDIVDLHDFEVYASRSSRRDCQKGRIFIPLAAPLSGADWLLCQKVFNDKIEALGFTPDRKSEGCGQICFLPNRGEFYESHHMRSGALFDPLTAWYDEIEVKRTQAPPHAPRSATAADIDGVHDGVIEYMDAGNWPIYGESHDGRKVYVECPNTDQHTPRDNLYAIDTSTSWLRAGTNGHLEGGFDCKHEHCTHIDTQAFKQMIGYDLHCFDVLDVSDEEYNRVSPGAAKAKKQAADAIEKAKFTSGRAALEEHRREYQKAENARIGEGEHTIPTAEVISLETAVNRFVFLSDGSRVADIFSPHYDLALSDWAATYAASTEMAPQPPKVRPDGSKAAMPDRETPVSKLWTASPRRKTAICRTFKAGGPLMLNDPQGRRALNSWKPFDRSTTVNDTQAAGLFLDHVDFLFGADAGRFLDWLAHIEQNPGVLPHTSWLHIAKNFGMGRNWLASVLSRVWAGAVAPNLDLVGVMKSGFNGQLSRKVLAIVDEIREGGRDSQWEHSEKLKSIITEEHRLVNPKYGRQSVEFNACRWLMFSQHLSAIPMENTDRRIEVVATEALPKPPAYYVELYAALNDPQFIAAVAKVLANRDISGFNPGAHAKQTAAKKAAAKASQTPAGAWCEMLVAHWPSDLITAGDLFFVLTGCDPAAGASLNAGHRRTLEQAGIISMGTPKRIGGNMVRLSVIRNKDIWLDADIDAIRKELQKALVGLQNARDYLDECAAE